VARKKKKGIFEPDIVLTEGSLYHIISMGTRDRPLETVGIFRGYTGIGADEGICIEMGEKHGDLAGKIRVIPTHMVFAIDIIEPAEKEDETEKREEPAGYFG